jgi:long-chain acyl-CoA synthetase
MPVGYKMADLKLVKKNPGFQWRLLNLAADLLIFRPIRDSLGLPHARICYATGARLSPQVIKFYHALNVPLKSLYGSTEAGAIASSRNEDISLSTVGTLFRGTEVQVTANGEMLIRQPGSFLGYYNDPAATARVIKNGWIHSGDSGHLTEDGQLIFIDRTQDIIKLTCGENMAPQEIESFLKFSPFIKDVWTTTGPDGSYVAAIIIIDNNSVSKWADKRKVSYTTFSDLSQKPEVYGLIGQEIKKINAFLSPGCRIKRFVNLHKEFDADEFELTRNRKLRREFLSERYSSLIEAIYSDNNEILIETQVRYRDGRTVLQKTSVQINNVEEANK